MSISLNKQINKMRKGDIPTTIVIKCSSMIMFSVFGSVKL